MEETKKFLFEIICKISLMAEMIAIWQAQFVEGDRVLFYYSAVVPELMKTMVGTVTNCGFLEISEMVIPSQVTPKIQFPWVTSR